MLTLIVIVAEWKISNPILLQAIKTAIVKFSKIQNINVKYTTSLSFIDFYIIHPFIIVLC